MAVAKKKSLTVSLVIPTKAEIASVLPPAARKIGAKWSMLAEAKSPDHFKELAAREVGDLSGCPVMSGRVLVVTYISSRTYKFGNMELLRTDNDVREDVWQACVGLVLKKGAMAFKDDETNKFHGQDVKVGDWVTFRPGDTKRVQINGVDCRLVEDVLIDMQVDDPTIITHFQSGN